MTKAMTALAVVFLMGAATPALAAPGDHGRWGGGRDGGGASNQFQRDGGGGRARGEWGGQRGDSAQRSDGQRGDGGQRGDYSHRDGPDRPAPQPPQAVQAPAPAQTVERRTWDRGDRGGDRSGDASGRQGWTRGQGFQDRAGGDPRPGADQRPDRRPDNGGRTWDRNGGNDSRPGSDRGGGDRRGDNDRRGPDRGAWDHRGDNDRGGWDHRTDGDSRNWDRRGDNDRSRWDRHDWNNNWPHWERGRYPTSYFSHSRYHSNWRAPVGFYTRIWSFGDFLPRGWYGPDYWIVDPWAYDLPLPPPGFDWVRVGDDALLIDQYTGRVVQVVRDLFW